MQSLQNNRNTDAQSGVLKERNCVVSTPLTRHSISSIRCRALLPVLVSVAVQHRNTSEEMQSCAPRPVCVLPSFPREPPWMLILRASAGPAFAWRNLSNISHYHVWSTTSWENSLHQICWLRCLHAFNHFKKQELFKDLIQSNPGTSYPPQIIWDEHPTSNPSI